MDESEKRIVEWLEDMANAWKDDPSDAGKYAYSVVTVLIKRIKALEHREKHNDQ